MFQEEPIFKHCHDVCLDRDKTSMFVNGMRMEFTPINYTGYNFTATFFLSFLKLLQEM